MWGRPPLPDFIALPRLFRAFRAGQIAAELRHPRDSVPYDETDDRWRIWIFGWSTRRALIDSVTQRQRWISRWLA